MELKSKLEEMLEKMGCKERVPFIQKRRSAYDLLRAVGKDFNKEYFDPVLQKIFDQNFTIFEQREKEILNTIEEVIINACWASCQERKDLFIDYQVYIGNRGIIVHIKDTGDGTKWEEGVRRAKLSPISKEYLIKYCDDPYIEDQKRKFPENLPPGGTSAYFLLSFAQDFQFNVKGNEVVFRFDL